MKNPFSDIPLAEASSFFLNLRQFPKVANMAPPQILPATAMGQNKVPMTAPSLTPTARGENAIKVARLKRAAAEMAALPSPSAQGATPLDPSAYLAVEQAGQDAQNANAVEFYKQKLEEAKTELAQLQEGQQAAQGQIQQLSEQMQQSQQAAEGERQNFQSMAAQATQQAAMAQDQALMAQRASAAMRMAYQQLRGSLLELAQNDPPAGTGGDPSTAAPPPMMGDPGMGGAGAPPGAAPAAAPQEAIAPTGAPAGAAPLAAKTASRPPSREELDAEWERVMRMERDGALADPHTLMSPSAATALGLGSYGGALGSPWGSGPALLGAGAGAALGATVGALQKDQEPVPVNHRDMGMFVGGLLGSLAGASARNPRSGLVGYIGGSTAGHLSGRGAEWLAKRKGQPSEKNAGLRDGLRDVAGALAGQARQLGGAAKDRAPMMAAGALLGGGASLASQHMGSRSEDLRKQLTQSQGEGGFVNALRTAATKARLALSEVEDAHPMASAGVGALLGAGAGFGSGPQMRASVGNIKNNLGQIRHLGKK